MPIIKNKTPKLPKRELLGIVFSVTGITLICWIYLILMVKEMSTEEYLTMASLQIQQWSLSYFWMILIMWGIMMVGMMLPSVAPMILIYAAIARKSEKQGNPIAPTAFFTLGYIAIWIIFSLGATIAQWGLDKVALLSPMIVSNSPLLGAILFIVAGIYQWLPVKKSCLEHCRSPFHFISNHWQSGKIGAFKMGLYNGYYCLGCCWVLMLLLFVGGVMNLLWIAGISLFVLFEKILPFGDAGGRWMGIFMITIGLIMILN